MIWIDERRCIGKGIGGFCRWCIFGNCEDIELGDEGDGDASVCGHLAGWVDVLFSAVLSLVDKCLEKSHPSHT